MRPLLPSLLVLVSIMILGAGTASAQWVCDPDANRLLLSAGQIQDQSLQLDSRTFDTGVEAPKVVLECESEDNAPPRLEKQCDAGVQEIFVTWHAGGQVEVVCMPAEPPPVVTPPTVLPEASGGSAGPGTEPESGEGAQN